MNVIKKEIIEISVPSGFGRSKTLKIHKKTYDNDSINVVLNGISLLVDKNKKTIKAESIDGDDPYLAKYVEEYSKLISEKIDECKKTNKERIFLFDYIPSTYCSRDMGGEAKLLTIRLFDALGLFIDKVGNKFYCEI